MQNELSVRRLSERDHTQRESFVTGCPSGSIFALPSYLDILCQATCGRFEIAGVFDGGELVGGIALYFERNRFGLTATRRKQSPLYLPEAAYKQFLTRLHEQNLCRLYHARLPNGQAVASQLVLTGPHPVCHTVCAGSAAEYLATGATPFLRWKAFERLAALGYCANDLTGAPYPHSVSHFKRDLGGELVANWLITRTPTPLFRLRRKARSRNRRGRRRLKTIWPPVLPTASHH